MTPDRLADLPDAELLTRIAEQSSRDALRELYDRHVGWVRARLRNRCADDGVVEDALQDTFVAIWRCAGSYRGSGAVAAWV